MSLVVYAFFYKICMGKCDMIDTKETEGRKRMKKCNSVFLIILMILCISGCGKKEAKYIEVKSDHSIFTDKFYYEQLSAKEKLIYQEIYQGIQNRDNSICIHDILPDKANQILQNIMYDFPEIFWIDGSSSSTQYGETFWELGYTVIEPVYTATQEERARKNAEIDNKTAEILASVPSEISEYEKVKYIYEYLIRHVEYVENAKDNQNIYSALVNGESVCAGYAKANQYLMNKLGIYCTYVTGTAQNENGIEPHAWNIVCLDGKYYYVDVTWADPVKADGQMDDSLIIYDYLCYSDAELSKTHILDDGYAYPICDSEDWNYYRNNQMYYESADEHTLLQAMYESIDLREDAIIFKFANDMLYEEGQDRITNELAEKGALYLGKQYGLREITYSFEKNSILNKVVVYWCYE